MMAFLSFKTFISTEVLIVFYYVGALIMPFGMLVFSKWLLYRFNVFDMAYKMGKAVMWNALTSKQKTIVAIVLVTCFMFMELFWRMLFEFLIAYMQIRDAAMHLQG